MNLKYTECMALASLMACAGTVGHMVALNDRLPCIQKQIKSEKSKEIAAPVRIKTDKLERLLETEKLMLPLLDFFKFDLYIGMLNQGGEQITKENALVCIKDSFQKLDKILSADSDFWVDEEKNAYSYAVEKYADVYNGLISPQSFFLGLERNVKRIKLRLNTAKEMKNKKPVKCSGKPRFYTDKPLGWER